MERKDSGNDRHREPPAGRFTEYDVTRPRDTCPFCEVKVVDYEKIPGRWTNELLWSNWHLIPPIQQNLIIIQPVRRPVKTSELARDTSIFTCCYNHPDHDPFYKTNGQWYIFAGVKACRAVKKRRGTKDRAARSSGMSYDAKGINKHLATRPANSWLLDRLQFSTGWTAQNLTFNRLISPSAR